MTLTKTDKIFLKTIGGASLAIAFANAAMGANEKLAINFVTGAVAPALLLGPWAYLKIAPHVTTHATRVCNHLFRNNPGSQRDDEPHPPHQ